jgi:tRNA wybutosine-synthesizing protein 2
MLALRVPKPRAEEARLLLSEKKLLDKHHRIAKLDGFVEIPLLIRPDKKLSSKFAGLGASVVDERQYAWRETFKQPFKDILKTIQLPEEKKRHLPRKWEMLGGVLVLKIDERLDSWLSEISSTYAKVLGAKTVLRDVGGVKGKYREPVTKILLGKETETVHLENGIKYKLDARKIMFSSGNIDERIRMASVCEPGEMVADMFAGIGYFTLPIAVHSKPKKIYSYEINPLAYKYLKMNIKLNWVGKVVRPFLSDCMDAEEGVADRVIMGYVGTTHQYLQKAIRILDSRGIIHYHETCPERLMPARPLGRIKNAVKKENKKVKILNMKRIKSFAPGVEHVVFDVKIY